ncbi:hypothetical protein ACAW74_25755 [Fibrella sp. WM1]|uniref:hypothetical protein n=1 Tax=Fibrella musci TaxID=3242485 RepID=UPI0035227442
MNNDKLFAALAGRISNYIENHARTVVRVEGTKHFKESFRNEGFTDETLEKWPDITNARKDQKRKKNGNLPPILTDTGKLGNSITARNDGDEDVVFSSDRPYAKRHNEGDNVMPQRQFMGPSKALDDKIVAKFDRDFQRILNNS